MRSLDRCVVVIEADWHWCWQWFEDTVPTVAFNLRRVRKGNVTMRIWDVAGPSSLHPWLSNEKPTIGLYRATKVPFDVGKVLHRK